MDQDSLAVINEESEPVVEAIHRRVSDNQLLHDSVLLPQPDPFPIAPPTRHASENVGSLTPLKLNWHNLSGAKRNDYLQPEVSGLKRALTMGRAHDNIPIQKRQSDPFDLDGLIS